MGNTKTAVQTLNGDATTEGSVKKQIADAKAAIKTTTDEIAGNVETNTTNIGTLTEKVTALEGAFGWGTF